MDDGSNKYNHLNAKNAKRYEAIYLENKKNLGRVKSRMKLALSSKNPWLLFLDADMLPSLDRYILNYYNAISSRSDYDVYIGGHCYINKPSKFSLRLRYGKARECAPSMFRNEYPYRSIFFGNILIKKELFYSIFNSYIDESYGEDHFLASELKTKKSKILHIDNNTIHLGIETNNVFLNKTEQAASTVAKLHGNKKMDLKHSKLILYYTILCKYYLDTVTYYSLHLLAPVLKKSLIWFGRPLLFIDLYRLYWFLKRIKNER